MEIDKKIAEETKSLVAETENSINLIKITNAEELDTAKAILLDITSKKKKVVETERLFLDPLNESRKNIIEFFKPLKGKLDECELKIKRVMSAYIELIEKKVEKKKENVEKKIAEGKIGIDEAHSEILKIDIKKESVNYRINKKVVIEDASQLPRKYLIPNEVLIRKDALSGVKILGVKVVEVKTIIAK